MRGRKKRAERIRHYTAAGDRFRFRVHRRSRDDVQPCFSSAGPPLLQRWKGEKCADSLTCLNFGDPSRPHPCAECVLMQYVPESRKGEDVPCHHIPLDPKSRTIATLDATEAEEVLKRWLRHEINRLEGDLAV